MPNWTAAAPKRLHLGRPDPERQQPRPRGGVDGTSVYWSNFYSCTIGRANLDGSGINQRFAGIAAAQAVAVYRLSSNSRTSVTHTDSRWSRVAKQRVASLHHRTVIAASVGVISAQDLHLLLANENKSAAGGTRRACCRWALRVGSSRRDTRAVRCIAWLGRFILCSVREITKRDESHLIT